MEMRPQPQWKLVDGLVLVRHDRGLEIWAFLRRKEGME